MPQPPGPPGANSSFVAFIRPKSPWEPMVRARPEDPHKGAGASALFRGRDSADPRTDPKPEGARAEATGAETARAETAKAEPRPPALSPEQKAAEQKLAALRAELDAKDAARLKEHAAAMTALKQQQAEAEAQRDRAAQLCTELEAARHVLQRQFRDGAGQLILEGARRIAGIGLRTQPELLRDMLMESIDALGKADLILYVSSQDVDSLRARLKDTPIRIESDERIEGGLLAESPAGRVDATMGTALQAISAVIDHWKASRD